MKNLICWIAWTTSIFSQSSIFILQLKNEDVSQSIGIVRHESILKHSVLVNTWNVSGLPNSQKNHFASLFSDNMLALNNGFSYNTNSRVSGIEKRKMLENGLTGSIPIGLFGFIVGSFNDKARLGTVIGSSFGSMLGFLYYKRNYNKNISLTKALLGSVLGGTAAYFLFSSSKNIGLAIFKLSGALILPPFAAHITVNI